jgi:hypothetical protein
LARFRATFCPKSGTKLAKSPGLVPSFAPVSTSTGPANSELVRHVAASTGLAPDVAARLVNDLLAYFSETTEQFVRRRHAELHRRGHSNAEIWPMISGELAQRRVAAAALSPRQLRRIVYG